mmetsp:Transcript_85620/g.276339  ORF Transcript_85620/g.276339 Transcript_85620/m.276339 type:complete len:208 (-) Transcript_85620:1119-1742(-)
MCCGRFVSWVQAAEPIHLLCRQLPRRFRVERRLDCGKLSLLRPITAFHFERQQAVIEPLPRHRAGPDDFLFVTFILVVAFLAFHNHFATAGLGFWDLHILGGAPVEDGLCQLDVIRLQSCHDVSHGVSDVAAKQPMAVRLALANVLLLVEEDQLQDDPSANIGLVGPPLHSAHELHQHVVILYRVDHDNHVGLFGVNALGQCAAKGN